MKLICAPMATLSHEAFRRTVESFGGCDEYFTEMINASSLVNAGPFERYYLLDGPSPEKIVWQLTGSTADSLAKAAEIVCEKGGAGTDINMGCSAPQIYKTGAGIAWMLKPLEETKSAVRSVRKVLDSSEEKTKHHLRLSIKCRLGDENFTEDSLFKFTDAVVESGAELITIHPRTIKEKYRGLPKYEFAEKLALRYENQADIYINGCIKDFKSAEYAVRKIPHAKGLMIARAAAEQPWIFAKIRKDFYNSDEKTTVDRLRTALDFIDNVEKFQPKEFHRTRIQRFFSYYCQQFSFAHYFQTKMLNYKSNEKSRLELEDYFTRQPEERFLVI